MKFLILIYSNPRSRAVWERMTAADWADGLRRYAELSDDLASVGGLVAAGALDDPSTGRRVSRRDGRPVASDGPYPEAKEHLAGFFLVDCDNIEQAVEYAARIPEAEHVEVEVRPVLTGMPDPPPSAAGPSDGARSAGGSVV
jgi:hypothetical protein